MIESLRPVRQFEGQPPPGSHKTLFFPRSLVSDAARLGEQEESLDQVLDLHFRRNLETLPCTSDRVRAELVEEAYEVLLGSHPLFRDLHQARCMVSIKEIMEWMVVRGMVVEEDPPTSQRVFSVLMPDHCPLSPHQKQILGVQALDAKMAPIYDPRGEAQVEQEGRPVQINLQQWCEQRLANVRRDGPLDQPGLLLAMALQHCTQRLFTALPGQGGENRPGTSCFYQGLRGKLVTLREWLGPPTFSLSVSFDPNSELMFSTWVSHTAGVEGKQEKVWHVGSEQQQLHLRPGKEQENARLQGPYTVHCRSQMEDDSCPFHTFCSRRTLEEWRERWANHIIDNSRLYLWQQICNYAH